MYLILFMLLQFQDANFSESLIDARNNFLHVETYDAAVDRAKLWSESEDVNLQAYAAAMYFMQARYAKSPITKWSRFKKGKKRLEELIKENPKNLEMKYLRFLFQNKMPEFLGYHRNRQEDLEFILKQIEDFKIEQKYKCAMLSNVSNVGQLTSEQKLELAKKLQPCS